MKLLVQSDRRLTVQMISDKLSLNRKSVQKILLHDLGMRNVCARKQNQNQVKFCKDMLEKIKDDPDILRQTITGDENWIFQYNPKTKRLSMQWKTAESPRPKKACISKQKIKVMLITFFSQKGARFQTETMLIIN